MFESWLIAVTEPVVFMIDFMALLVVACATLWVFFASVRYALGRHDHPGLSGRAVWLTYARWLVAALTLQLAADILESSITPSWQAIAELGAIAVIRTFLNYFLDRDISEVRELQKEV